MEALANWLWQGCAVTLAATAVLRGMPRTTATTRHRLWWVALALVLAMPFASSFRWFPPVSAGIVPSEVAPISVPGGESQSLAVVVPALPSWALVVVLGVWAAWVGVAAVRFAAGLNALVRAKRSCRAFPGHVEAHLPVWRAIRTNGRPARLVISDQVSAAAVLGLRRPSIAVAPVLLEQLTPDEIDQVLVHEWAHVQRRDDIGRLVQVAINAIAGLHPAVWWIDRQLQLERETACDDWTVNITGSRKRYAECLTKLATLAGTSEPVAVPAVLSSSTFTTRIGRLLDRRRDTSTERRLPSLAVMSSLLAASALIAAGFELVVSKPLASEETSAAVLNVAISDPTLGDLTPTAGTPPANAQVRRNRTGSPAVSVPPTQGRLPIVQPAAAQPLPGSAVAPVAPTSESPSSGATHPDAPSSPQIAGLVDALPVAVSPPPGVEASPLEPLENPAPWRMAADAGVAVGRGSQKAAVATAGFFTRLGKSIARRGHSIVTVTGDSHD